MFTMEEIIKCPGWKDFAVRGCGSEGCLVVVLRWAIPVSRERFKGPLALTPSVSYKNVIIYV